MQMDQSEQDIKTVLPEPVALAEPRGATETGQEASVFTTKNISIYYGSFKAVTDVSLTIYQNEITAFIGSSGSGKTTVLRAVNREKDLVPRAHHEGGIDHP